MRTFLALALLAVLTACGTHTPTPVLTPAAGFISGESQVPPDRYPFIEAWNSTVGYSTQGNCPGASLIDFPAYSFVDGQLHGIARPDREVIGFFGKGSSNDGAMGGGTSSELTRIEHLPLALPGDQSVQSILEDGTLVLQLADGKTYWLPPGQSSIQYFEDDPHPSCHVISTVRLTNYGLLEGQKIFFGLTPLAPVHTPAR